MRVWLPFVRCGSGADVYTFRLAAALRARGVEARISAFPHWLQYAPRLLSAVAPPADTDIVLANSWNGFAFAGKGKRLVVVNHHSVFDPRLEPYKGRAQRLFHEGLLRRFEARSNALADAVVAVSDYTRDQVARHFPGTRPRTLYNGIDTEFFSPGPAPDAPGRGLRILFVGNLSQRKGADLLAPIMQALGPEHHLYYTNARDTRRPLGDADNLHPLGRLDDSALRDTYRGADAVLFPTRLEGFGYAAVEAMACARPVVASAVSSLPEIIRDGVTGCLCPVDDVDCFVARLRALHARPRERVALGSAARADVLERFSSDAMADRYLALFAELLGFPS
jgi:glycosyltransferase involved in cell wall biosynthesis